MAADTQVIAAPIDTGPSVAARRWKGAKRFVRRQPLGTAGVVIIVLLLVMAIFAPWLNTVDPKEFGEDVLVGPSSNHWFGTNRDAQDMWSRVVYGAPGRPCPSESRRSSSPVIGGTIIGLVAGYLGGWVDIIISRAFEVLNSIPAILFGLVIGVAMGAGLDAVIIAVSIAFTPAIGRIMRGGVLAERNRQYVEAARVLGVSETRIMWRHLLPNLAPLMIVLMSTTLPAAILTEAALSYLGVGLPVGDPLLGPGPRRPGALLLHYRLVAGRLPRARPEPHSARVQPPR